MQSKDNSLDARILRLYSVLLALAGFAALLLVLVEPSDPKNAWLFGYSRSRLLLAAVLLGTTLAFAAFAVRLWRGPETAERWAAALHQRLRQHRFFLLAMSLAVLGFVLAWALYFFPESRAIDLFGGCALYLERLKPALAFFWLASALTAGLAYALRVDWAAKLLEGEKKLARLSLGIFVALVLLWALIALTGIGLGFDVTGWNAPGTPLVLSQVFWSFVVALALLALAMGVMKALEKRGRKLRWLDAILFIGIWLVVALIWNAQPPGVSYYATEPRPPNYEAYPRSDAFNHDVIAQNVLIGEGIKFGDYRAERKPLYALFLAGLHMVGGQDYALLISLQTSILAVFPALLYLLGAKMHSRLSGLFLAAMATWREVNSLTLSQDINSVHVKMLMTEMQAAIALTAFVLVAFHWLEKSGERRAWALLAGGALGLCVLLRSQVIVVIPVFAVLIVLSFLRQPRRMFESLALFGVGAALALTPWLARNYAYTGQIIIEQSSAAGYLAQRYSLPDASVEDVRLPGETEGEYYARYMSMVRSFAIQHPAMVAGFVADNSVRNTLDGLMPLPASFQLYTPDDYVRALPFWPRWDGSLARESLLPVAINLAIIAIGLAGAWRKYRWAGLVPLFLLVGYNLSLAAARISGWRYNFPADWVVLLYYAMGVGQMFVWAARGLLSPEHTLFRAWGVERENSASGSVANSLNVRQSILFAVVVLFAGSSLNLVEILVPQRYETPSVEQASLWARDDAVLLQALDDANVHILWGRALYPVYFNPSEAQASDRVQGQLSGDQTYVSFYLLGHESAEVILPLSAIPAEFPQASEVLVLGCEAEGYVMAFAVVFLDDGEVLKTPQVGCSPIP